MQLVLSSVDEVSVFSWMKVDQAEVLFLIKILKALSKPLKLNLSSFTFEFRIFNIMANLCTYVYFYLNRSMSDISKKKWL